MALLITALVGRGFRSCTSAERSVISWLYVGVMCGVASLAPANAQASFGPQIVPAPVNAGPGIAINNNVVSSIQTVSGVAPVGGNVAFGCPLGPFNAGTNMAVTQMDNACALHYAGPLETQAQAATDIASAITPLLTSSAAASTYQPIGAYLTASALAPYLTISGAALTYQPIGSYLTAAALTPYLTSATAASTYLTQTAAASTYSTPASVSTAIAGALSPYLTTSIAASTYCTISACTPPTPYTFAAGAPNTRTISLSTAYQATNAAKPALVNVNLTSTATISLTAGSTNTATVVIGSTSAVAIGTGTPICNYANTNTGTLTIGLNLSTVSATTCSFILPTGWYWAVRQTAGTVTITSAFDQSTG